MDNSGAAGPGKVGLAAGGSDDGGDKIHGSKDGFLTDDVAVVILKKIAADENILNKDSPALILHGVEFDSDIKNYKDKADTDKNQGAFIIILFHFSAPFDFSWLPEPERK